MSPKYLQTLMQGKCNPKRTHSLQSLKSMFSAGAPLPSAIYAYVRNYIKHVFIHNGSGGTDVCASFMGGCTVLPIYAGVIQVPYLGFAIEAAGEDGQKLTEGLGDLVIARPAPNMPLGLVGDDKEKTKFRETYFNHYSSRCIWYHADYGQFYVKAFSEGRRNADIGVQLKSTSMVA